VDAFCGDQAGQNHVNLRFAGGAGGFSGKCLRVAFLSKVLSRLGFTVEANGDVLDASFKGAPKAETESALDQLGRLLASSRLLDMAITGQAEIDSMAEAFLRGDYDLLSKRTESPLPGFHLTLGDWERLEPSDGQGGAIVRQDGAIARQDGSKWATGLSRNFAGLMGRVAGQRYQRFLDSIEAYFHFPLAVAKDSDMGDGRASLKVRPVAGTIDRAGGLAFAVRSAGTYLVLRINALEDNVMLFAFTDGVRKELSSAHLPVETGVWRELSVEVQGGRVTCFVDGKPYLVHHFDQTPRGLLGLWSKADSVAEFADLTSTSADGQERSFPI
jgi:pyruvate,water dikinase